MPPSPTLPVRSPSCGRPSSPFLLGLNIPFALNVPMARSPFCGRSSFPPYAAFSVNMAHTNPAISRATAMAAVFRSPWVATFQNL